MAYLFMSLTGLRREWVCVGPFSIGNILAIGSELPCLCECNGAVQQGKGGAGTFCESRWPRCAREDTPGDGVHAAIAVGRCVVPWPCGVPVRLQQWQLGIYWQRVGVSEWMSRGGFVFLCASWFCVKSSRLDLGYVWFDLVFQGRYPATKVVIKGAGEDGATVLVKFAQEVRLALDDLILLKDVEIRPIWRNTGGLAPETLVVASLASRELAVSNGSKRKAGALQCLAPGGIVQWAEGKDCGCVGACVAI